VRVVAGSARGRPLEAPPGRETRPTTDRVREALFNALASLDVVAGAEVLDLFAGTGALGIEALSRGAAHATFVERDARARALVQRNLERTGLGGSATVVGGTGERFVATTPDRFDLALLDPPYAFSDWDDVLAQLDADVIVVESDREIELGPRWEVVRPKWYGSTLVVIARALSVPSAPEDPSDRSVEPP
jgi:16S rRNA (guanine966-N2)-methyltransferase